MSAFPRHCIVTFSIGVLIGILFAYILLAKSDWKPWGAIECKHCKGSLDSDWNRGISYQEKSTDSQLADELSQRVRVLCWVMTNPRGKERCESIKATWGKRCNILLFMSSHEDPDLPTVKLDVMEGRLYLWGKAKAAFAYVYEHYFDSADWFMKADDDTYVMVDNLRYMLQAHSPAEPVYFGRKFFINQGFMSGGSGYVLSREALSRFVNVALRQPESCIMGDEGEDDVEMGSCLANVGVRGESANDCKGMGRFFPIQLEEHLLPGRLEKHPWYFEYTNTSSFDQERDCCSETAVGFHYVGPETMQVYEFFIHHIRPYGIKTHLAKSIDPQFYC